jgi:type IV secretory pathway TrbF-like protein
MTSEVQAVGPSSTKSQKPDQNGPRRAAQQSSNAPIGKITVYSASRLGIFIFMQKLAIAK